MFLSMFQWKRQQYKNVMAYVLYCWKCPCP